MRDVRDDDLAADELLTAPDHLLDGADPDDAVGSEPHPRAVLVVRRAHLAPNDMRHLTEPRRNPVRGNGHGDANVRLADTKEPRTGRVRSVHRAGDLNVAGVVEDREELALGVGPR